METHVALLPSAGMGHLMPFLRLASMLASRNCKVTLLTAQPAVSAAESNHLNSFFTAHPHIQRLDFHVLPIQPSNPHHDPFFLQFEAIIRSVHLLPPLLSSLSPPISALFLDIAAATCVDQLSDDPSLSISYYILSTTSARFFSLISHLPHLTLEDHSKYSNKKLQLPGLPPFSISNIPPPLFNPENLFTTQLISNSRAISKVKGIVSNTFRWFESETIEALNSGNTSITLPQFLPIGPFKPYEDDGKCCSLSWLDEQPAKSVVYVSFGSRTAMSKDQIKELGEGLLKTTQKFLWVLKSVKVDKVEETGLEELLGSSLLGRIKEKRQGMVVKEWVKQEDILAHPAIGGFFSHCGWNSLVEAAQRGMPMLAWTLHGDQRFNAEVVEKAGLGLWPKNWGWLGERLVKSEEIEEKIEDLMQDHKLRSMAQKVGEEAIQAWEIGGTSEKVLGQIIEMLTLKV
ncbi:UDP-glycosyltransferase 708C1-like [Lycium ferocissimum]|uniref:UDP-glycosyltransferase 708C1-like n=1 Tax=Lycium ferocissimum TaxID=112874 RepID=UPI002814E342|nr:UDP-glycosyltransferase 708C1-like [Lycium ferocissimum]